MSNNEKYIKALKESRDKWSNILRDFNKKEYLNVLKNIPTLCGLCTYYMDDTNVMFSQAQTCPKCALFIDNMPCFKYYPHGLLTNWVDDTAFEIDINFSNECSVLFKNSPKDKMHTAIVDMLKIISTLYIKAKKDNQYGQ